ncbi:DMT family transporter [Xenophilus arseniciresistens]|uniref:DMT family transporter n=1 Tax=Xenophilus arseniciresistens TaxID=1283306 RepID=A0AAE3NCE0_9BURK|nr:DMT family transporter [Xenophilus arseniciresistens]MDA7417762.1 DMT family transporter [Xenophilus arseniciresistens]
MTASTPLPRPTAMLVLAAVACGFAANHVAARLAFDNGTGLLTAILCRAGLTLLVLALLVAWRRDALGLPPPARRWQLVLGLLIAVQSLCLYSAVARIPVALALLVSNSFPILLALLTWASGGARPTRAAWGVMGIILVGLLLALDVPARLAEARGAAGDGTAWGEGIGFALGAAVAFALSIWVTDKHLRALPGAVRSLYTMGTVCISMALAGLAGLVPGGLAWPQDATGWTGLACLMALYCTAFIVLFILVPRLDMARNAPVMNMEPVATLLFGWLVLGQWISPLQMAGGLVVLSGIVLLSRLK